MKTKTLAIGLFPERVDIVLCAGSEPIAARRTALSVEHDGSKWPQRIRDLVKIVRSSAQELGAVGLPVRVFYRSPAVCAEFASPRARSAAEAASAAMLACADSLSCPIDLASTRSMVIWFDKSDAEPKAQCVVSADSDESLTAIFDLVEGAGLRFDTATPIDAVTMAHVAFKALEEQSQPAAVVHVGEHRSFVIIAERGRITFARPIAVGLNGLVASLKRPIRISNGQCIELTDENARAILHECGVPSRTQIVDERLQLTGGHIIPLLQPMMQRLTLEVRQSLRFALPENVRNQVAIHLVGPGARTPSLTQIVADELGLNVAVQDEYRSYDFRDPLSPASELMEAVRSRRATSELALEPLALSRKRRLRQMQRWLWAGAAASVAIIGADAARLAGRITEVESKVERRLTQSEDAAALKAESDRLLAATQALSKLERAIETEVGARVCMGAVLHEISRLTPPSIRLNTVTFRPGSGVIVGGLSGFAVADDADPEIGTRLLESYMRALGQSPLLTRLSLANVQATLLDDIAAQSFDVSFDTISAPIERWTSTAIAGAGETQEIQP